MVSLYCAQDLLNLMIHKSQWKIPQLNEKMTDPQQLHIIWFYSIMFFQYKNIGKENRMVIDSGYKGWENRRWGDK